VRFLARRQQLAKALRDVPESGFNSDSFNPSRSFLMSVQQTTSKRRAIDGSKFNALSVAIISAAAFTIAPAFAQMQAPAKPAPAMSAKAEEAFKRADKNADGKLSKDEAAAMPAVAEAFDKADVDKDGALSKAEFAEIAKE
jgi:hypothetical protein